MKSKIKIFVATHKIAEFPKLTEYVPLNVGSTLRPDLGYLRDDKGDNISIKNPYFCELTGLYYIWKNENADIVGLTHYRRYFFKKWFSSNLNNVLNDKDIELLLRNNDIIVPKKQYFNLKIRDQYKSVHNTLDLEQCGKIIKKIYGEYYDSFECVMNQKWMYCYNMFIMPKQYFDEYMEWLFNILNALEKEIDISNYDKYNQRVFGFLSERLFNVWLNYKKYRVKEVIVYNTDESKIKQIINILRNKIKRLFG